MKTRNQLITVCRKLPKKRHSVLSELAVFWARYFRGLPFTLISEGRYFRLNGRYFRWDRYFHGVVIFKRSLLSRERYLRRAKNEIILSW